MQNMQPFTEAAYGIPPERQTLLHVFLEYSKSLQEFTSELLTRKIVRDDTKIETLRQAMDEAEKIHKQARQDEITKLERSVNERHGDRKRRICK